MPIGPMPTDGPANRLPGRGIAPSQALEGG